MANKYGVKIGLRWHTSPEAGDVCPACQAMDGQETVLGRAFIPQPYEIETSDGRTIKKDGYELSSWNDYGQIPDAHVNCKCYFSEFIIEEA